MLDGEEDDWDAAAKEEYGPNAEVCLWAVGGINRGDAPSGWSLWASRVWPLSTGHIVAVL